MTFLIVGLDRRTLAPWHENVSGRDAIAAKQIAVTRARACGINLVVAAVIGANSTVLAEPVDERARLAIKAA
jgi:hypothetical protein